jgi:hypothetical protein
MLREGGASSTPRLFDPIISVSEYWITRLRVMTCETIPAARIAPEFCMNFRPRRAWGTQDATAPAASGAK